MAHCKNFFVILFSIFVVNSLAFADGRSLTNDSSSEEPRASQASGVLTASQEDLSVARGHYARAKNLLIEAIREFDAGATKARVDAIFDSAKWRESLIARAEELNHVLDPQPRASNGGARFVPLKDLLNETERKK